MSNLKKVKYILDNADSRAYNHNTKEYMARKGQRGVVIPEGPDGPILEKGKITPLSTWAKPDF